LEILLAAVTGAGDDDQLVPVDEDAMDVDDEGSESDEIDTSDSDVENDQEDAVDEETLEMRRTQFGERNAFGGASEIMVSLADLGKILVCVCVCECVCV
jgi:hypothetical protein